MSDSRMTELNEILGGRPSRFAFRVLRRSWILGPSRPAETRPSGWQKRRLGRWPARTRHVAANCNRQIFALLRQPSWRLVRSLYWVPDDDATTRQLLTDLVSDPNAKYLRRLLLDPISDEVLRRSRLRTCFPHLITLSVDLGWANERETVIPFLKSRLPPSLRYLKVKGIENLDDAISDDVPEVVDAIASSPVSRRLRAISLPFCSKVTFGRFIDTFRVPLAEVGKQFDPESLERLCDNPELASGLKRLNLCGYGLDDQGVAFLARCPYLAQLEHLNLSANAIGPEGLALLAGLSMLPSLKWLDLSRNPLGDDGWKVLGRLPFRKLRHLTLWNTEATGFGARSATSLGARSLARSQHLHSLRSLILIGHKELGDEGISRIPSAPFARRLSKLNINMTGLSAATAEALASRPLEALRVSSVNANRGGAEFARRLARSSVFPSLWSLDLGYLHLGDEGVEYVAQSKGFPHLKSPFSGGERPYEPRRSCPGRLARHVVHSRARSFQ